MSCGIIIQARVGSSRFPKKILKKFGKLTMIEFLIKRLKKIKNIKKIIIAIPKTKENLILKKMLKKINGIFIFEGSENNVLDRYVSSALKYNIDVIVRITSDCPLIDPHLLEKYMSFFLTHKYDYLSNIRPRTFPDGLDIEIFTLKALKRSQKMCKTKKNSEHVTGFMSRSKKFKKYNFKNYKNYSNLRWTIDYKEDYEYLKKILKNLTFKQTLNWKNILANEKKFRTENLE